MAGKIIFRNPLSFQNGTGFTTDPSNTEVNALTPVTFTYSIGQAVSPSSSVVFGAITSTDKFTIDNGSMILSKLAHKNTDPSIILIITIKYWFNLFIS